MILLGFYWNTIFFIFTFGIDGAVNQVYAMLIGNIMTDTEASDRPNAIAHVGYSYVSLYLYRWANFNLENP